MISIDDLRYKNLVLLNFKKDGVKTNKVCYVSGIDEDETVTLRSLDGEKKYTCDLKSIKPIKLGVRLLREIGFEKEYYQDFKFVIKNDDSLEMAIGYRDKKFYMQLSYFHDPTDALGQIIEHELDNLLYLHQFQNIYKDFTGYTLGVDDFFKNEYE